MTYQTPCTSPENDPDDWFIGRDGRQYPDDELVTMQDAADHLGRVDPDGTRTVDEFLRVREELQAEAVKANLKKRRHAKDACFVDCLVRTRCLDLALTTGEMSGTWGGYYEEELRTIRNEIARRKRRRTQRVDEG